LSKGWGFFILTMIERKCLNCGTWNTIEDCCKTCGKPISQREIERVDAREKRIIELQKPKDAFQLFAEKLKNHRYFLVRVIYRIGYSITLVFGVIGAFFAWMIALANG